VTPRVLLLPGLYDSGPGHWQTHWEHADPSFVRVRQRDWENADRGEWVATLNRAVEQFGPDVVLAAHSTSCALVAFWARETGGRVRGAMLVAPSDTEAPGYPRGPTGWTPMPLERLPFPSLVVASTDDEYVTIERAGQCARAWGSRLVGIGAAGHINSTSGLGEWPQGRSLLEELLRP
jgi:serine hydrolase